MVHRGTGEIEIISSWGRRGLVSSGLDEVPFSISPEFTK